MKAKTMILMGLAITCGLGASYMTSRLLAERSPSDEEKVKILVLKKNVNVGQRITDPEEFVEFKEVSKESEPPDSIKDLDFLKGKTLKQGRTKGDHLTAAHLRSFNDTLKLPEGHFAQGLKVTLEGSASGFASLPGSRVNIVQTVTRGAPYSQMLLADVLVLAADLKLDSNGELASPAQVVTFALKQEDVLKVNLAKELGILSLALRNVDEKGIDTSKAVYEKDIRPERQKPSAIEDPITVTPPPKTVVEVKPDPVPQPDLPKIVKGHYDIIVGTESGAREVRRVYWSQEEDGPVVIERTEMLESTRTQTGPADTSPRKEGPRT
jgi:pilus assembly protein CpaB